MNLFISPFKRFFLFFSIIIITSCTEEEDINNEIMVETISNKNINEGGVILSGSFINISNNVDFGFVLSTIEGGTYDRRGRIEIVENVPQGTYSVEFRTGLNNGQKYYFNVFIFLNDEYIFGKERPFVSNGSTIPIIKELSSNKVSLLDTLLIRGSYFSENPKVYFSDEVAVPFVSSDSLIKVVVPFPESNYLSTKPYSRIKIVNDDNQENTINNFSLNTPRIDSIIPKRITDSDTLKIYGDYFDAKRFNMVFTVYDNQEYNYKILESTKNKIILKPLMIRKKNPTLVVRSQLSSVSTQMEVLMPEITSISTNCLSFGDNLVIKGANFPLNNNRDVIKLENNYLSPYIASKDSLVFKMGNAIFKDFKENEITINYLDEVFTSKYKICIDEPWIRVNYDYEFNYTQTIYTYNNDIYALGYNQTQWGIIRNIYKFNKYSLNFEKITDENFNEDYSSNYGALNVFYKNKMYSKKYFSSNKDIFMSYNIFTNEKKELADFPGEQRQFGFMIVLGEYIYTGLGEKYPNKPIADIWRYSINNDSWEKIIENFPGIISSETSKVNPLVFVDNNKIYIGSGQRNGLLDFWELDTNSNQIIKKSDLPNEFKKNTFTSPSIPVFRENKIYFHNQSMFEYDTNNDIWRNYITNGEKYDRAGYFYLDNEIYMKYDRAIYKFNSEYLK